MGGLDSTTDVAVSYSQNYLFLHNTWYARPWDTTEGNATRLAAPQTSDTYAIPINFGAPYGYGNKDMASHVTTKYSTNNNYSTSRFYDYWEPESRRIVMYCPNVYYSSGLKDPNNNSDALRFSGESDTSRTGWVGVDCSGLFQRVTWLAGYQVSDDSTWELGRIGLLNDKGEIIMNTWGGERSASWYATTSPAQDVTDWINTDGTSAITTLPGMGPIRQGDMVVYRDSGGTVRHVAIISIAGTTQTNTYVDHAVWSCRYVDSVTNTNFFRRVANTQITVLPNGGSFKIRRLTTIRY